MLAHLLKRILSTLLIVLSVQALAQKLFMPLEIKSAYERGTRKWDGTVSDTYFQNRAKYDIRAKVNPETRQVDATGKITYFNNFPESFNAIGFHAYKEIYDQGMEIKKLIVDGETVSMTDRSRVARSATFFVLFIGNNPLLPGDSITLEIEWSIMIPASVDRDGAYDETSMFVAYWYPEIAVYDDIFGWDQIDFDGRAEFYHDVSDFNVAIEIPDNYVIWASDKPTNGSDIYPSKILKRLEKAKSINENTQIITPQDLKKGIKMKSNLWKYASDSFPDFSFAFSNRYLWDATYYTDKFGTFFLNSAYPEENRTFSDVIQIEKEALQSFHNDFPVYPFPFRHFVVFNGETGGGMEFAGMANDQARENYTSEGVSFTDYDANKLLTFHEMMHMYFPFLMGINEKRYAWMDEGMAEFSEDYFTKINLESDRDRSRFGASSNPPLMVETFTIPKTYGVNSYDMASQSYHALLHLLGKDLFDQCMKEYMDRWKYKHPSPYDFFFTFNDVSRKNINWFWKRWYFDWGYPDVAVKSFSNGKLTIENVGGRPIAVQLNITYEDGTNSKVMISPEVWKDSNLHEKDLETSNPIKSIELKTLNGSDTVQENNRWVAN